MAKEIDEVEENETSEQEIKEVTSADRLRNEIIPKLKERAAQLKKEKGARIVHPIIVAGRSGEKEFFVGYFGEPNFSAFSKFLTLSKSDELKALRVLANDLFIEGDKEMIDDDSIFLFGTSGLLSGILSAREGLLVNL